MEGIKNKGGGPAVVSGRNNLPSRNLVDRLQRTVYAELVSEPTKRPKSASASRPKTAPFPDARRQKDVDQMRALSCSAACYYGSRRALRALREIESREKLVKRGQGLLRRYRGAPPVPEKKRTSRYMMMTRPSRPRQKRRVKEAFG